MHATYIAAKDVPRVVAPLGIPPIACSTAETSDAGSPPSTGDIVGNPIVGSRLTGAVLTGAGLTGTGVIGAGLTGDGVVTTASVGAGVEKVSKESILPPAEGGEMLPVVVVVVLFASVGPISPTGAELGADADAGGRVGVFVPSNAATCFLLAVSVGLSVGSAVVGLEVMTDGLSVGSLLDGLSVGSAVVGLHVAFGLFVGFNVGLSVGLLVVGLSVGLLLVGLHVGSMVVGAQVLFGFFVRFSVGLSVGLLVDGASVGMLMFVLLLSTGTGVSFLSFRPEFGVSMRSISSGV